MVVWSSKKLQKCNVNKNNVKYKSKKYKIYLKLILNIVRIFADADILKPATI